MNPQGAIAFQTANNIGNNLGNSFKQRREENTIESILTQANASGDPQVLQDSIGKILSSVSPERQGVAIKYLEQVYNNVQAKQKLQRTREAEISAGVTPGLDPRIQAAQLKENSKNARINAAYGNNVNPLVTEQKAEDQKANVNTRSKDQLIKLTGHPDREISEPAKSELKNLQSQEKNDRSDIRELKKETLPLKQEIINRANASRESIRNKNHLIEIIDKGNLDDPTFAVLAESLPFNLGKRLLSDDTIEYKGGLVDEFADLKNIFKGATRVKEVEIYENKLADTYLTDSQKKAILKSRINTAKIDLIREEAAAEVEELHPSISALQFSKKVDEIAKPKINALFNSIWDEQKAIFDQAEARKEIPLDMNDPDDLQIIDQILKESGGNFIEAEKLAKKKRYKF